MIVVSEAIVQNNKSNNWCLVLHIQGPLTKSDAKENVLKFQTDIHSQGDCANSARSQGQFAAHAGLA